MTEKQIDMSIATVTRNGGGVIGQSSSGGGGSGGGSGRKDPCSYEIDTKGRYPGAMAGHSLDEGFVVIAHCPANIQLKSNGSLEQRTLTERSEPYFTPYWEPPPPPPPSPEEVARLAVNSLKIPDVAPNIGPGRDVFVHVPQWLWMDDPGVQSATVNLQGVEVTASAEITQTRWSMGEPMGVPGTRDDQSPAVVSCAGAGVPPPPVEKRGYVHTDWDPECGYAFNWASRERRTPSCQWPVNVTVVWTINWTSNLGPVGQEIVENTAQMQVPVWELKTRLVFAPPPPEKYDPNALPCVETP